MEKSLIRKSLGLSFILISATMMMTLPSLRKLVHADTGKYAANRVEVGNTFQTRFITLPATTVTLISSALDNRPDETCVNNSAVTIWISSNVASSTVAILQGVPVLSSGTFRLGAMSGAVYATPDSGASEVRCGDGMTL